MRMSKRIGYALCEGIISIGTLLGAGSALAAGPPSSVPQMRGLIEQFTADCASLARAYQPHKTFVIISLNML